MKSHCQKVAHLDWHQRTVNVIPNLPSGNCCAGHNTRLPSVFFAEPELRPCNAERHRDDHVPRRPWGGGGAVRSGNLRRRKCGETTRAGLRGSAGTGTIDYICTAAVTLLLLNGTPMSAVSDCFFFMHKLQPEPSSLRSLITSPCSRAVLCLLVYILLNLWTVLRWKQRATKKRMLSRGIVVKSHPIPCTVKPMHAVAFVNPLTPWHLST